MELTVDKDLENRTLTVVADFDHPVEKVWELYADPRKMERWWGPPTYPATVVRHELAPGGVVHYFMTSPGGRGVPRPLGCAAGRRAEPLRGDRSLRDSRRRTRSRPARPPR